MGKHVKKWPSTWKEISGPAEYNGHAIYQIRLVDSHGKPVTINRFTNKDEEGILYIGKASNMEQRHKAFIKSVREGKKAKGRKHTAGNLIFLLKKYVKSFKEKFGDLGEKSNYKLQYCFKKLNTENEAKTEEIKEIKAYIKKYGEAPPLNSSIPSRYGEGWEKG